MITAIALLQWLLILLVARAAPFNAADEPGTTGTHQIITGGPWWQSPFNSTPSNQGGYNNYADQCILWDKGCGGNRNVALDNFFNQSGTVWHLVYHPCEWTEHRNSDWCHPWLAPPALSASIQNWMRQPDCVTSFREWHSKHPEDSSWTFKEWQNNAEVTNSMDWGRLATTASDVGCCDGCAILGGNVDVFYWPVSGANSDCLPNIGTSHRDIDDGFFTQDDRGHKYFLPKPNPYATSTAPPALITPPPGQRKLRVRGGGPLFNLSSVYGTFVSDRQSARSDTLSGKQASLSVASSGSQVAINGSLPANRTITGSTAVVSGYTLTSPSLYVGFSHLAARDRCGTIGSNIDYTLLAFKPGELSTIEAPNWQRIDIPASLTKSFDFADMPCPPKEKMMAIQYKPEPGAPYRPMLAPPSKLHELLPGWSHCELGINFQGIDPPRALTADSVLVPAVTPASLPEKEIPQPAQAPPLLAPAQTDPPQHPSDPGKTGGDPVKLPPSDPKQLKNEDLGSTAPQKAPDPQGQGLTHDNAPDTGHQEQAGPDLNSGKSNGNDLTMFAPPKDQAPEHPVDSSDPSNVSPGKTSGIKQAVDPAAGPDPQAGIPANQGADIQKTQAQGGSFNGFAPPSSDQKAPEAHPIDASTNADHGQNGQSQSNVEPDQPSHMQVGSTNSGAGTGVGSNGQTSKDRPNQQESPNGFSKVMSPESNPVPDGANRGSVPPGPVAGVPVPNTGDQGQGASGSNDGPNNPPSGNKGSGGAQGNAMVPINAVISTHGANGEPQVITAPIVNGGAVVTNTDSKGQQQVTTVPLPQGGENAPQLGTGTSIIYGPAPGSPPPSGNGAKDAGRILSPSIGPHGEVVYYSTPTGGAGLTPVSTYHAPPGLSASLGPANNVVYYSTAPGGAPTPVSTMPVPPGMSPSLDSTGGVVYYSNSPGASPTPVSTESVPPGLSASIGPSGAIVYYSTPPGGNPTPVSTKSVPPGTTASVGPSGVITYYSGGPGRSPTPVSTESVPPGLSASIGPSGAVVYYSTPSGGSATPVTTKYPPGEAPATGTPATYQSGSSANSLFMETGHWQKAVSVASSLVFILLVP